VQDATVDVDQIRRWWRTWPTANIAIATGAQSGIIVLDTDPRHGGDWAIIDVVEQHGPIDYVAHAITGGNGDHYYLRHPGGRVLNGSNVLGPGLDIRGDGGYVIAPPSLHESGARYAWVGDAPC
jgi:putative DNA primase/helicase